MARYDLVVVGGGTAGLVAAVGAAGQGARVLLAERDRTGGDCLWTGCVPSKALLTVAEHAHIARTSDHLGVHAGEVRVDLAEAMATSSRRSRRSSPTTPLSDCAAKVSRWYTAPRGSSVPTASRSTAARCASAAR